MPSGYVADEETTVVGVIERGLRRPAWEQDAILATDHSRRAVRLPRAPRDRGLVFRSSSGVSTTQWSTGEEYYIVLSESRFAKAEADVIFEEWHRVGNPEGWHNHILLWVRTRDPLAQQPSSGHASVASPMIDEFQRATRILGLPNFEHLWHPRGRLIGGSRVPSATKAETFAADDPPLLEVKGLWESPLRVALTRWDPVTGSFVTLDALRLQPSRGVVQTQSLWEEGHTPSKGRYRIEVDTAPVEFELVDAVSSPEPGRLRLRLELALQEWRDKPEGLLRRALERGLLVGHAWPGARLQLKVTSGGWSRSFEVCADAGGVWSARWKDLGLGDVPRGSVEVALCWKDLVASRLTFADGPYVAEQDVRLAWRREDGNRYLALSGLASNVNSGERARAVLLGPRPWAGEIRTETLEMGTDGAFEARFSATTEVRWLIILPEDGSQEDAGTPWLVQTQTEDAPNNNYPLADLRHGNEETWEEVVSGLRGASLPPALRRLLDLSALGSVLEGAVASQELEARWLPAERNGNLQRLASWAPFGLRAPAAVFTAAPSGLETYTAEASLHLLEVEARQLHATVRSGEGELPLECSDLDGRRRRVRSRLRLREGEDGLTVELQAKEQLYACPQCGLILPPGEFANHRPPSPAYGGCNEFRRSLRLVGAGRQMPVQLRVRSEPKKVLEAIEQLVRRVAEGDERHVPAHAEPWLDRLYESYAEEAEEQDPSEWVELLNQLLERLRVLKEHTEANELWLADLGRSIGPYERGLQVINEWARSEVK